MELEIDRKNLLERFIQVAGVAPARSPKPILQNVLLQFSAPDVAWLSATDHEVSIRTDVDGVTGKGGKDAAVLLPVQRMLNILRELPDDRLSLDTSPSRHVTIKGSHSNFELPSPDPDLFPEVLPFSVPEVVEVGQAPLHDALARTVFAAAGEGDRRYALHGVKIETEGKSLHCVATDGRRISVATIACEGQIGSGNLLLPSKAAAQVLKMVGTPMRLGLSESRKRIEFNCGGVTIRSVLVDGRFPDWRSVFRDVGMPEVAFTTHVGMLHQAVRQAGVVSANESDALTLRVEDGVLYLSGSVAEVGTSRVELPVSSEGQGESCLRHRFLLDFLRRCNENETVEVELRGDKIAVLKCGLSAYGIMPMAKE